MWRKPSPVVLILLVACWSMPESALSQARPFGGITGLVRDEAGNPIIGAIVRLLPADAPSQPVKTLRTDMGGKYLVKKLAPGVYRVRAEARGFLPMAQVVEIKPYVLLSFDFELRRTETLAERREDRDDYRWAVRASRRPVLRFNKNGETEERFVVRLPDGWWRGQALVTSGFLHRRSAGGTMNLAFSQEISPQLEVGVATQTNGLGGYPGRWEIGVLARPLAGHHLRTAIVVTEWRAASEAPQAIQARRLELRIADRWYPLPELSLIGGVDVQRTTVRGHIIWDAAPRFGVQWNATDRMRIKANFLPFTVQDAQTDLTHGGRMLPASYPIPPQVRNDGRVGEEGHHWHIGVERMLGETQAVEIAVFQSAIPTSDIFPSAVRENRDGNARDGESRCGVRVLYTRSLGETVRATVGYAFGHRRPHPAEVLRAMAEGDFHLFAGRVDARLVRTRTRLAAHFRAGRGWTITESDPFYNLSPEVLSLLIAPLWEKPTEEGLPSLPLLDPGVTLVIAQELPTFAFLPGRWEAIIEARNIIAWAHNASADGNALVLVRAPRLIRGSLAVRF